jgi:hypothetical protein
MKRTTGSVAVALMVLGVDTSTVKLLAQEPPPPSCDT